MIIAIDGPAAVGKGTLARRLAERLSFAYLDTGLLYRAVGMAILREGTDSDEVAVAVKIVRQLNPLVLYDPILRLEEVGQIASHVAAIPAVRAVLLDFQRAFAHHPPAGAKGAVMDGRDIGTVVCPKADHKLFVTASLEVRVQRRVKELREQGVRIIEDQILEAMRERDHRDRERIIAPLVPARGALILDTSEINADTALAVAVTYITAGKNSRGGSFT